MATTFNEVMETMLTKKEQEAYRAVVASLNKEQREEYDNLIKKHDVKDVEVVDVDKSDYWIVYGEYHEGDDIIMGSMGADRFKTTQEALKEFKLKVKEDFDVVYMDSMIWDEEAEEWDQDSVEYWGRK